VEGFSEYNFIKHYLKYNGKVFTEDFNEIRNHRELFFLKNCKSDSSIFPSLKNDQWWIEELTDVLIIIVSDLDHVPCYTSFKLNVQDEAKQLQLTKPFKIINSKPEIEQIYMENIPLLKKVIKSYYNQESINPVDNFEQLKNSDKLTFNCANRFIINEILRVNGSSMSKKTFSDKFFANAFQQDFVLSITQRLQSIIDH